MEQARRPRPDEEGRGTRRSGTERGHAGRGAGRAAATAAARGTDGVATAGLVRGAAGATDRLRRLPPAARGADGTAYLVRKGLRSLARFGVGEEVEERTLCLNGGDVGGRDCTGGDIETFLRLQMMDARLNLRSWQDKFLAAVDVVALAFDGPGQPVERSFLADASLGRVARELFEYVAAAALAALPGGPVARLIARQALAVGRDLARAQETAATQSAEREWRKWLVGQILRMNEALDRAEAGTELLRVDLLRAYTLLETRERDACRADGPGDAERCAEFVRPPNGRLAGPLAQFAYDVQDGVKKLAPPADAPHRIAEGLATAFIRDHAAPAPGRREDGVIELTCDVTMRDGRPQVAPIGRAWLTAPHANKLAVLLNDAMQARGTSVDDLSVPKILRLRIEEPARPTSKHLEGTVRFTHVNRDARLGVVRDHSAVAACWEAIRSLVGRELSRRNHLSVR